MSLHWSKIPNSVLAGISHFFLIFSSLMGASKEVLHSAQIVAGSKESEMVLPFKHLQFKIKIKIKPEDRDWKIH